MADWASESGHWYDTDGTPRYTIIGKNCKERATTIRDAREYGWVPSVTTIIACAQKWGLEAWKQEQAALAALTTSRRDGETDADLVKRILTDAKEQAKKAAERGTEIHAAVEAYYREEKMVDECPTCRCEYGDKPLQRECTDKWHLWPWVESVVCLVNQEFGQEQDWRPEKSFAHPLGYGGKVDLHSDSVLIDFKGKEAKGGVRDWATYPEHAMQLAAYAQGLHPACNMLLSAAWPRCGIVFFDRAEPYAEWHEVKPAELDRGWRMFEALLAYWKAANL